MSELRIYTDNHPRDLLYWHELTSKEQKEFNWIEEDKQLDYEFFRYRGNVYCLAEFYRCSHPTLGAAGFNSWDGYSSDSFFSGILIRYPREEWGELDTGHIIVGWYCC